jgi:hypothetical protein
VWWVSAAVSAGQVSAPAAPSMSRPCWDWKAITAPLSISGRSVLQMALSCEGQPGLTTNFCWSVRCTGRNFSAISALVSAPWAGRACTLKVAVPVTLTCGVEAAVTDTVE